MKMANRSNLWFAALLLGLLLQLSSRAAGVSVRIINVDTSGCTSKQILPGGFGQSFVTNENTAVAVNRFEVWLEPNPNSFTSYQMRLFVGSGCSGTDLGTSFITNIAAGSQGAQAGWYPFSFPNPNDTPLYSSTVYTFQIRRLGSSAGSYQLCGNKYAGGKAFSDSCSGSSISDISFRLTIIRAPRIQPGTTVSLQTRTSSNSFVSANNFPNSFNPLTLAANRAGVGQYETFAVEDAGSGRVALRCLGNNRYVRFYNGVNGNELRADATSVGAEARLFEGDVGNAASGLRASNGLWVGVETGSGLNVLKANQANVGPGPEEAYSVSCLSNCG